MTTEIIPEMAVVVCPVCEDYVYLHIDYWHTDCAGPEREAAMWERLEEIREQNRQLLWEKRDQEVSWSDSRNGGYHTYCNGIVLVVKQMKDGRWSCGGYQDGSDTGEAVIPWKRGFRTSEKAKENAVRRAREKNEEDY